MFTYEKVPLPPIVTHQPLDLDGWRPGFSFVVPDAKTKERVRARARQLGYKVAFRQNKPAGFRCWRLK